MTATACSEVMAMVAAVWAKVVVVVANLVPERVVEEEVAKLREEQVEAAGWVEATLP